MGGGGGGGGICSGKVSPWAFDSLHSTQMRCCTAHRRRRQWMKEDNKEGEAAMSHDNDGERRERSWVVRRVSASSAAERFCASRGQEKWCE